VRALWRNATRWSLPLERDILELMQITDKEAALFCKKARKKRS
jgi:hypothetical protein